MKPHRPSLSYAAAAAVLALVSFAHGQTLPQADTTPFDATVTVDAGQPTGTMNHRMIGGTNIALWNEDFHFNTPLLREWVNDLETGLIRLPGGSWSNAYYWNGNGVRNAKGDVDSSKVGPDGYPAVDYSDWKPGFMVDSKTRKPATGFHGNVDIKTLHDFVKNTPGAVALPSLNAGTGRAVDAGEWAKWAKKNGYESAYWHVGNELGGAWEPGNFLPDGSAITADDFVNRYKEIAKAVKAVDPNAKLGSFAFNKDVVEKAGDLVGFVSIHTYPGSTTLTFQENLANVPGIVSREVGQVRGWINEFQPDRKDEIEIGYTEWNLSGGLNSSDLFSGLWTSMMLGEFAKNGVNFTTQWDVFTHVAGMNAGHGMIFTDGDKFTRKAAYYALQLWNRYNGDKVLSAKASPEGSIFSYASRSEEAVYVMLVNPSDDRQADVTVKLDGFPAAAQGEKVALTHREYHWNPNTIRPEWSQPPRIETISTGDSFKTTLAPFSVTYLRIPSKDKPELSRYAKAQPEAPKSDAKPGLEFIIPAEIFVGDKIDGLLRATDGDSKNPYQGVLPAAKLTAEGPVTLDRKEVRLAETLGRFSFIIDKAEPVTLKASVDGVEKSINITAKPSVPRPMLIWDFQSLSPSNKEHFESDYKLTADLNQRPNKEVARIDLSKDDVVTGKDDDHKVVFRITQLPPGDKLNRANIRGVFFDIKTLNLVPEDPNASITVAIQSPADYWMVIGTVPLAGNTDWKRHELNFTNPKYISAIASGYNIWFVLNSSKPVEGTILLDKIGFMVR